MSAAVAFALASLACAGLLDVSFKAYARVARSRGLYLMGIGLAWTALQAGLAAAGEGLRLDAATLAFGLAAGALVAISNLLLIESLGHVDVGLGSTIYRLNTIAVVLLAVVLLDESLTVAKVAGVGLGVAAVMLLFDPRGVAPGAAARFGFWFALAIAASLLRAGFGILAKFAATSGIDLRQMLLVNAPVWILLGALYAWRRRESFAVERATLGYAALSGALIFGVANFLMLALERAEASVVVPIANMSFLVALVISAALGMERMNARKAAAVALAVAAIVVLARA